MKEEKDFSTTDIVLATTLLSLKHKPKHFLKKGKEIHICFDKTKKVEDLTREIWTGGKLIEPYDFYSNFKKLKTVIREKSYE